MKATIISIDFDSRSADATSEDYTVSNGLHQEYLNKEVEVEGVDNLTGFVDKLEDETGWLVRSIVLKSDEVEEGETIDASFYSATSPRHRIISLLPFSSGLMKMMEEQYSPGQVVELRKNGLGGVMTPA